MIPGIFVTFIGYLLSGTVLFGIFDVFGAIVAILTGKAGTSTGHLLHCTLFTGTFGTFIGCMGPDNVFTSSL